MKLALLSQAVPPAWSGQAMVIEKLLREVDPAHYLLVSSRRAAGLPEPGRFVAPLPGRLVELPPEPTLRAIAGGAALRPLRALELAARLALRARRLARIVRAERCTAIVACSGDLLDLPAAAVCARRLGLPLFVHLFDDYAEQWTDAAKRAFARLAARRVLRAAAGVLVPNEGLAEALRQRHGIASTIVRNPVELGPSGLDAPWPAAPPGLELVYTGALYEAHFDAVRDVVEALGRLGGFAPRLHLYTTQRADALEGEGIGGPRVQVHPHVPAAESLALQRRADVLLLPLAFRGPAPEVVRTAAPGKLAEYLASGRPLLVHAPPDAFVTRYVREHDCAAVADAPGPEPVAAALREIVERPELRRARAERARGRAEADFALDRVRRVYLSRLGLPSR